MLPSMERQAAIRQEPGHPKTAARADLLQAMRTQGWRGGRTEITHRWKHGFDARPGIVGSVPSASIRASILTSSRIIRSSTATVLGRAAKLDFKLFGGQRRRPRRRRRPFRQHRHHGSAGFEKSLKQLRQQPSSAIGSAHRFRAFDFRHDLRDGGGWDWTGGEPPKTNPAYYLRFCKSYSRMGSDMYYLQCDNASFLHHLYRELQAS
ncbi:MAG: hypothetical protein U0744_20275 [Gemmataceae bacterium]